MYKLPNGKLKWEKVGLAADGYTAADAAMIRGNRIRAIRHGEELPQSKTEYTFGQAYSEYIKAQSANNVQTVKDESVYYNHLKELFSDIPLSEVTPFMVEKFKQQQIESGLSNGTVWQHLRTISAVYKRMMDWGLHKGNNPVKAITLPKVQNAKQRYLELEEWHNLLDWMRTHCSIEAYAQAAIALYQGARKKEVLELTPNLINFDENTITLIGKGDARNKVKPRTLPLHTELAEILKQVPMPENPDDRIFNCLKYKEFDQAVAALELNKDIPKKDKMRCTFHTLRHTFASWMVQVTNNLYVVSKMLGHSDIRMTQRYAHLIKGEQEAAFEMFQDRLTQFRRVREWGKLRVVK